MSTFIVSENIMSGAFMKAGGGVVLGRGCWHDSHHGYTQNAIAIIADAVEAGFVFSPSSWTANEVAAVSSYQGWEEWEEENPDSELLFWAAESAEDYLASLAPAGYWIGWREGDFGMWRTVTEDDCLNHLQGYSE